MMKPKLAIVSSYNIRCPLAYYADALNDLLGPVTEQLQNRSLQELSNFVRPPAI
ncbi:MAG: hypothetical protein ABSA17_09290 [Rhabdochlamydiaceae bacterium]